jgi:hypothetical protein
MTTTEDKLKKILDKELLETLPTWLNWVKEYSLKRFNEEVQKQNQTTNKLQENISLITGGKS